MLVLFDVDGTLLLSSGQGARAMEDAGREVLGPTWTLETVEFAGRLDPLIFADGLRASGFADGFDRHHEAFRAAYARYLTRRLAAPGVATALPGVLELLERLRGAGEWTLGLLTGNYPETGAAKLRAAGLDPSWFPVPVWGIDGPTRRDLPPVGIRRFREATGRELDPAQVVIVGDTVHDIDCARHNGCRALAVATGPSYSRAELERHRPDLLVDTLADADAITAWLAAVEAGA